MRSEAYVAFHDRVDDGLTGQEYVAVAAQMGLVADDLEALAREASSSDAATLKVLATKARDCAATATDAGPDPSMDVAQCQGSVQAAIDNFSRS